MTDDEPLDSVLLSGLNSFEARMIRGLLKDVGIPCMFSGPDFDKAELGEMAHGSVRGVDILVPTVALAAAKARVDEAWGGPEDVPAVDPGSNPKA